MPLIETKPKLTTKTKRTTVSPGIISEVRSFCCVRNEGYYENIT